MFIGANTVVSLPCGVAVDGDGLFDAAVNHNYKLNETGNAVVRQLLEGATVGEVCRRIAAQYGCSADTVFRDIRALLHQLNQRALIHVHTPGEFWARIRALVRQPAQIFLHILKFVQTGPEYKIHRYPASLQGIWAGLRPFASFMMYGVLFVAAAIFLSALLSAGAVDITETALLSAAPVLGALLFLLSLVVHEYGHLWSLRRYGAGEQSIIIRRGFSINVAHPQLPRKAGVIVALSGPLPAMLAGLAATGILSLLGAPRLYTLLALLISISHLYTLTPWNKDGRVLWKGAGK